MRSTLEMTCTLTAALLLATTTVTFAKNPPPPASFPAEFRTIDGSGNNPNHPSWGSADVELLRRAPAAYEDGVDSPAGADRGSAREISNLCVSQDESIPNHARVTDFVWQWGQFVDHDIDLTPGADPAEPFNIAVPTGDPWFDPAATGTATIGLDRSVYNVVAGVRQQLNEITAFIDGSNVYGSDELRAETLRPLDGTGRLKTSAGGLLPFNEDGLPNAPSSSSSFFLAGDVRANEQVGLTAMHTLFVREHNYWAGRVAATHPGASDDEIYNMARAIVGAELQAITYREFLPLVLGNGAIKPYKGYKPGVNAGIENIFSTASYRFGHSMLSPQLLRLDNHNQEIAAGNLSLADSFFNPTEVQAEGIEPLLRGLARQRAQEIDSFLVSEVRNFLFGPPGSGGFDLASLNIQRGRDHGLPSYNQVRVAYGLPPVTSFAQINPDPAVRANLAAAYNTVDDIDAWVGGLAERHVANALVGPTVRAVLADQFTRLRDGDRFWYESYMPKDMVKMIERQTLATIIKRNTAIGNELPKNIWRQNGQGPNG